MADPTQKKYDTRLELTLSSSQKEQLMDTGNANRYLRDAAANRLRRYREARALLDRAGWTSDEIRAVCDVLNGTMLTYLIDKGEQIAASMEDAADLNGIHEKWEIERDRWEELTEAVCDLEPIARAIWDVQEEHFGPSGHVDL